ncbi:MAG: DNA primase [Clostridia bacterium]
MAYYKDDVIDEILSANDIVDVINSYTALTKKGRNYVGLCPFHNEKTPSFSVSLDKQIFKCFGCSVGGNVITFISKIENLSFGESIEFLAERSHIKLDKYVINNKNNNNEKDIKDVIYNINKEVAKFYHNNLIEELNNKNSNLYHYLVKRNIDKNTLVKFGLGYSSKDTYKYLLSLNFSEDELLKSGVVVKNDKNKIYDRFYNRLIFPIIDTRDRIIAFGGRVLDNSLPKYINSPETPIYTKGKHLYGLNIVKHEKINSIVITEGYMDCVSLHKNGINNAVASLGTALTLDQARNITYYTSNAIIAYDQDTAGKEATIRGMDILKSKNINVKVLKLDKEDTKDPDEYINKYGCDRFKKCLDESISLPQFKIDYLSKDLNLDDVYDKIKLVKNISSVINEIDNKIEREIYIDKISKKYDISKDAINNELKEVKIEKVVTTKKKSNVSTRKKQEQYIIAIILGKDKLMKTKIFENVDKNVFENEKLYKIYENILILSKEYDISKIDVLSKFKDEHLINELTEIMYIDIDNINEKKLLDDTLKFVKCDSLEKRKIEINNRLKEDILEDEKTILLFELSQISIELNKINKGENLWQKK